MKKGKIPVSAIVVGLNEARKIATSMKAISFCDEIIYVDLGSTDDSLELAGLLGATVHSHERVPSGEWINSEFASKTKHDWILLIDPDEVVGAQLGSAVLSFFDGTVIPEKVGALRVPWLFYFKGQLLKGTPWGGGGKTKFLVAHRNRFEFRPQIHLGRGLKAGFQAHDLPTGEASQTLQHFWMDSWSQLLEKHRRYVAVEGQARFEHGQRSTIREIVFAPLYQFAYAFGRAKGYRDGFRGFLLSCFWSWYQTASLVSLWKYQQRTGRP